MEFVICSVKKLGAVLTRHSCTVQSNGLGSDLREEGGYEEVGWFIGVVVTVIVCFCLSSNNSFLLEDCPPNLDLLLQIDILDENCPRDS